MPRRRPESGQRMSFDCSNQTDARSCIDPALLDAILAVIREHPGGLSEHALIAELRRQRVEPFADARLREPLSLFRSHFLLFHCLYRLRDQCAQHGEWLRIDCLDIGLASSAHDAHPPGMYAVSHAVRHDPLRAYYLDLDRLKVTDAAAVEALLSAFWRRLGHSERRQQALDVLGLVDPVDDATIQARYRSLVQRHHPDRGGDADHARRLNEARWILLA